MIDELKEKIRSRISDFDTYVNSKPNHHIGLLFFFVEELNKIKQDLSLTKRKEVLIEVFGYNKWQLTAELEDYKVLRYFKKGELVPSWNLMLLKDLERYADSIGNVNASIYGEVEKDLTMLKEGIFDLTNVAIASQKNLIAYYTTQLNPLLAANLKILQDAPANLIDNVSLEKRLAFAANEVKIHALELKLRPYVSTSQLSRLAALLGLQFVSFGKELTALTPDDLVALVQAEVGISDNTMRLKAKLAEMTADGEIPAVIDTDGIEDFNDPNTQMKHKSIFSDEISTYEDYEEVIEPPKVSKRKEKVRAILADNELDKPVVTFNPKNSLI